MNYFSNILRIIVPFLLVILLATASFSAPVVPIPGEAGSFLYFPADIEGESSGSKSVETIGRISIFSRATLPDGWLECNGATVSSTDYPELVEYLTAGSATSAPLPDLRGVFLRGQDAGRGIDPGRVLGSFQSSQNLAHAHTGSTSSAGSHNHLASASSIDGHHAHVSPYGLCGVGSGTVTSGRTSGSWASSPGAGTTMSTSPDHTHAVTIGADGAHTHSVTISAAGGLEARPRNISVIFAIRAAK